ncbi:hypothetical protein AX15_000470 [Amanita polypyramis BW_CC]|nr:hypothetical protein AX15_000470 [Amanita polypyramis BW_CC]
MISRLYNTVARRFSSANNTNTNMASVKELVESTISDNRVVIFSKSWCPYCRKAKDLFATNYKGEEPVVFELDEREDGSAIQNYLVQKTGQRTVPNIFVMKQHIGGSDDTNAAQRKGKLAELLSA